MSEVRRDNKGRKLWTGESQRKDGKYEYKYQDAFGVRRTVYSWKLTPADTIPKGKRNDISLREKEKQIQKELDGNLAPNGGNLTVLELVEKYVGQKRGVRHNTMANYRFVINIIKKEVFGQKRIDKIKKSDAKEWLIKLQDDGRGYRDTVDSCFWTRMTGRWSHCIGKSIFSTSARSTTRFTGKKCRKLRPMFADTLSVPIWRSPV